MNTNRRPAAAPGRAPVRRWQVTAAMTALLLVNLRPRDPVAITVLLGKDTLPAGKLLRARDPAEKSELRWSILGSNYDEVEQGKNVRVEDRVEHAQRSLPDWHRG